MVGRAGCFFLELLHQKFDERFRIEPGPSQHPGYTIPEGSFCFELPEHKVWRPKREINHLMFFVTKSLAPGNLSMAPERPLRLTISCESLPNLFLRCPLLFVRQYVRPNHEQGLNLALPRMAYPQ